MEHCGPWCATPAVAAALGDNKACYHALFGLRFCLPVRSAGRAVQARGLPGALHGTGVFGMLHMPLVQRGNRAQLFAFADAFCLWCRPHSKLHHHPGPLQSCPAV